MTIDDHPIEIVSLKGRDIAQHLEDIAALRIEVFREWPYLYQGSMSYEQDYLSTYTDSPDAIAVLALTGKSVVGAATGLPLAHETDEFKRPFIEHGFDPAEVFYCAESILRRPYRGLGLGHRFFDERERHARSLGGLCYSTFCRVARPETHPARPADYIPLDAFWRRRGYEERADMRTTYAWTDRGDSHSSSKPMVFWIKTL